MNKKSDIGRVPYGLAVHDEEEEKAEDSEDDTEEKSFNDLIEAFAYILTSK